MMNYFKRDHRLTLTKRSLSKVQIKLCRFHEVFGELAVWKGGHRWDYISYNPKDTITFMSGWKWNKVPASEKLSDQGEHLDWTMRKYITLQTPPQSLQLWELPFIANLVMKINLSSQKESVCLRTEHQRIQLQRKALILLAWLLNREGRGGAKTSNRSNNEFCQLYIYIFFFTGNVGRGLNRENLGSADPDCSSCLAISQLLRLWSMTLTW